MTKQKNYLKPGAILLCLLALAFSSSRVVRGQNGQVPDKREATPPDYVIIEGDIQAPRSYYQQLVEGEFSTQATPIKYPGSLWPNGVVPFEFDENVSEDNRTRMIDAMAVLEGVANVDFQQCGENDCFDFRPYVHIQDSDRNSSHVGMDTGSFLNRRQDINIASWFSRFIMVHELMHCLGFFHEQTKPGRDNWVKVHCENVERDCGVNFGVKGDATNFFGWYDFESVMHYGQCFFSKNPHCPTSDKTFPDGGVTITVLPPNDTTWQGMIGQRNHLSWLDQVSVSFLYPFPGWTFLDVAYDGDRGSSNGSFLKPYTTFAQAVANTPAGGTIWILRSQTIPAVGTYGREITVRAAPGVEATLGD